MNCHEIETLMDGYLDGELDLVRSIDLERHLHDCPSCGALHASRKALAEAIASPELRYAPPPGLARRVQSAIARRESNRWWPMLAAAAVTAAVIGVFLLRPSATVAMEREVVDSHIRSLMPNHLTDVVSTDQHTVKPWFAGKLDFSPPVRDFSVEGFPLVGGRLDYIGRHAAAAIVYRHRDHVINLFTWPSASRDSSIRASSEQGYNVIETVRGGVEYWIVSDLNADELRQFAAMVSGA